MFESALKKLIIVYMSFVLAISVLFSVVLYQVSITALQRGLRAPGPNAPMSIRQNLEFEQFRLLRYEEQKSAVLSSIIFLNISIIGAGGLISYYLAKRTLDPIKQAMDRQARFTADAAHELRTPLSIMRAENEVALRDTDLTIKEAVDSIESNLEEVIRLQNLTETLLELSSNNEPVVQTDVHLKDAINNTVQRRTLNIKEKSLIIKKAYKDEVVLGDKESIEQIISILLDNAIKYSPSKKTIELKTIKNKNNVLLKVIDHGIGIKKSDVPFIFDRFFRGDSARTRNDINGHGLGLSLAKQIATKNSAEIYYEPTKKGGSTFVLKLKTS